MEVSSYKPKERYSGKVESYIRHRPSYPLELLGVLKGEYPLEDDTYVADIGSGTGIFTRLLLDGGYKVFAVEPNEEMRRAAEVMLGSYENFISVSGSAEETLLCDGSVGLIVSAQAFHWFDPDKTVREFNRILAADGTIALVWNNQNFSADEFHVEYENVLKTNCPDYLGFGLSEVAYSKDGLQETFSGRRVVQYNFDNFQELELDGLKGRVSSVSYCPPAASSDYQKLMHSIERLFSRYQRDGKVRLEYDVVMFCISNA